MLLLRVGQRAGDFFVVEDEVAVALFGQEALAVGAVFLIHRLLADDGVEVGLPPIGFGAQDAAQALCFFLPRAKGPRDLDGDTGIGQVDGEVGDFRDDQCGDFAFAEFLVQHLRVRATLVLPVMMGKS